MSEQKIDRNDNRHDGRAAVRVAVRLALAAVLGLAGVLGAARSSDHAPRLALEKLDCVPQRVVTLTHGAGAVNAAGAVRLAAAIDTANAPGEWWLTDWMTPVDFIGGAAPSCVQRVVWGDRL